MHTKRDKETNSATKTREKLPESKKEYGRPSIKGIQYMFVENASEIKAVMAMNALDDLTSKTYVNGDEIMANMLKEPKTSDYLVITR
jgi:hypothetical protein